MVTNKKKGKSPTKPKASKTPSKGTTKAPTKSAAKIKTAKETSKVIKSPPQSPPKTHRPTPKETTKETMSTKTKKATKKVTAPISPQKSAMGASEMKSTKSAEQKTSFPSLLESMMPYKFEPYNPKPGEEYMSERQLKHFRGILDTWKRELMKEVDHTISEMKGATVLADPNDRATQEEAFNLELRTRDRERKLIRKIEEALQQIEDKEYGYCESCGVEIGIRRLEARPTAVLCIDCKTLDEIRERNIQ